MAIPLMARPLDQACDNASSTSRQRHDIMAGPRAFVGISDLGWWSETKTVSSLQHIALSAFDQNQFTGLNPGDVAGMGIGPGGKGHFLSRRQFDLNHLQWVVGAAEYLPAYVTCLRIAPDLLVGGARYLIFILGP